ncbi:uncharacterized protein VTP21DRAFT_626 [Calcarisporiella thermophila]|uniref:uncharacterized protein n=1 Tax=Calcarisporiella thermophila TaxID=911321 RepID=UPI00374308CF
MGRATAAGSGRYEHRCSPPQPSAFLIKCQCRFLRGSIGARSPEGGTEFLEEKTRDRDPFSTNSDWIGRSSPVDRHGWVSLVSLRSQLLILSNLFLFSSSLNSNQQPKTMRSQIKVQ